MLLEIFLLSLTIIEEGEGSFHINFALLKNPTKVFLKNKNLRGFSIIYHSTNYTYPCPRAISAVLRHAMSSERGGYFLGSLLHLDHDIEALRATGPFCTFDYNKSLSRSNITSCLGQVYDCCVPMGPLNRRIQKFKGGTRFMRYDHFSHRYSVTTIVGF